MIAVALYFAAGVVLGAAHLLALGFNVRGYVARGPTVALVALHVARLAATGLALWWLARERGALVLVTLAAFTLTRALLLRWRRQVP